MAYTGRLRNPEQFLIVVMVRYRLYPIADTPDLYISPSPSVQIAHALPLTLELPLLSSLKASLEELAEVECSDSGSS